VGSPTGEAEAQIMTVGSRIHFMGFLPNGTYMVITIFDYGTQQLGVCYGLRGAWRINDAGASRMARTPVMQRIAECDPPAGAKSTQQLQTAVLRRW
jgi:hypothetical protein